MTLNEQIKAVEQVASEAESLSKAIRDFLSPPEEEIDDVTDWQDCDFA